MNLLISWWYHPYITVCRPSPPMMISEWSQAHRYIDDTQAAIFHAYTYLWRGFKTTKQRLQCSHERLGKRWSMAAGGLLKHSYCWCLLIFRTAVSHSTMLGYNYRAWWQPWSSRQSFTSNSARSFPAGAAAFQADAYSLHLSQCFRLQLRH